MIKTIAILLLTTSIALAGMSMQGPDPVAAAKKCDALGYRAGAVHTACIRALRADFCGDGTAHTIDGIAIDIYDPLGIQRPTPPGDGTSSPPMQPVEAEWGESGATCVSASVADRGYREGSVIAGCVKVLPRCSQAGRPRALVITARR